jgi:hypothetical protein
MVERPWLEDDAEAMKKVTAFMKNGGSIDDVYTKFRMKNATKQELINLNK